MNVLPAYVYKHVIPIKGVLNPLELNLKTVRCHVGAED